MAKQENKKIAEESEDLVSELDRLYDDISERLAINKLMLHEEAAAQPLLYAKAGEAMAEVKLDMERAKLRIGEVEARLDSEIRSDWKAFGFDTKPTEKAISSIITVSEEYSRLQREYYELDREQRQWASLTAALSQRSSMIKVLAELFLADYFGLQEVAKDLVNDATETVIAEFRRRKAKT